MRVVSDGRSNELVSQMRLKNEIQALEGMSWGSLPSNTSLPSWCRGMVKTFIEGEFGLP